MGKKIVFLDRDGVINRLVKRDGRMVSPRRFADFEILPNVKSAIKLLRKNNYEIVVVTNQPDISRGLMEIQQLEEMNRVVLALGVGSIKVCPHSDIDNCLCRKPKPGLIIDYLKSVSEIYYCAWMIGDDDRDEEASRNAGIPFIRILRDREKMLETTLHQATNLSEAVTFILEKDENI